MAEESACGGKNKKSVVEWIVIVVLVITFSLIWLYAHWNLSRQPPYHKGPTNLPNSTKTNQQ